MRHVPEKRKVAVPPLSASGLTIPVAATSTVSFSSLSSLELQRGDSSSKVAYSDVDNVPVLGSDRSYILSKRSYLPSLYTPDGIDGDARSMTSSITAVPPPPGQHAADQESFFFSDKTSGSLRVDKDPIQLFSVPYLGLLFTACASGFSITFLRYGFRPLLVAYLSLHHPNQFKSAQYILEWPGALAVFFGLVSDSVPICGYRRKPYMILGWVLSFVMFTNIPILTLTASDKILLFQDSTRPGAAIATSNLEKYPEQYALMYVLFAVVGSIGLQMAWVTSLAMTVELAQREPLYVRGHLQSLYMTLYYTFAFVAQVLVSKVLYPGKAGEDLRSEITMGEAGVLLAVTCALAFPMALFFLKEDKVTYIAEDGTEQLVNATDLGSFSLRVRMRELLRFCQQQVVYRVILFVCGIVLILGVYNQNLRDALATWSGITPADTLNVQIAQNACIVLGLVLWKAWFVNTSWQKLVVLGVSFYVLCSIVLTVLTVFAWVREGRFFLVFVALLEVPKGWFKLMAVVPATEIAEPGREGVIMGLVFSFQALVYITANIMSLSLSQVIGTNVMETQVRADSTKTRETVVTAAVVYYLINLSSVMLAPVLPAQKIEVQQMRAYGVGNPFMGYLIAVAFVLLLLFGLAANIVLIGRGG
ncbi:Transmembrane protein, partial [Globisporangium splendens]